MQKISHTSTTVTCTFYGTVRIRGPGFKPCFTQRHPNYAENICNTYMYGLTDDGCYQLHTDGFHTLRSGCWPNLRQ